MALNEVDPAADRSTANGVTTVFPYTFEITTKNDIEVLVGTTVKTVDVDYTVSGVGDSGGGNITFVTAPANLSVVTRLRKQPAVQSSTYTANEGFPHSRVESDFDKIWMAIQQIREQLHRAMLLPKSSALVDQGMDVPTVGSFARGKVGGGIDWATVVSAGSISVPVAVSEGGTGATTAAGARTAFDVPSTTEAVLKSIVDAKGDLIAASADNTPVRVAVGSNGQVLTANSAASGGVDWQSVGSAFTTGDLKMTLKTAVDAGWVAMNDGTIGSATSGATNRANADTEPLYTHLWDTIIDQWAPVTGGRGASAAADFAANKPMRLPLALGRSLAIYGTGGVTVTGGDGQVDIGTDVFTVPSNLFQLVTGMPVVFTLLSGTITGLTSGNTYYVIRTGLTTIQLASSLANAQNGTAINMTAKSTPSWNMIHTYNAHVMGENGGQETHAISSTELLSHTHTQTNGSNVIRNVAGSGAAAGGDKGTFTLSNASTGGNAAMTILGPTLYVNVFVKL